MKSRSNSSNKAKKQMFEAKNIIDMKQKLTGNGFWPTCVYRDWAWNCPKKLFTRMKKLKNPQNDFENKYFQKS